MTYEQHIFCFALVDRKLCILLHVLGLIRIDYSSKPLLRTLYFAGRRKWNRSLASMSQYFCLLNHYFRCISTFACPLLFVCQHQYHKLWRTSLTYIICMQSCLKTVNFPPCMLSQLSLSRPVFSLFFCDIFLVLLHSQKFINAVFYSYVSFFIRIFNYFVLFFQSCIHSHLVSGLDVSFQSELLTLQKSRLELVVCFLFKCPELSQIMHASVCSS